MLPPCDNEFRDSKSGHLSIAQLVPDSCIGGISHQRIFDMIDGRAKSLFVACGMAMLLTSCSEQAKEAGEQKTNIDAQKTEQKEQIDQRAGELKAASDIKHEQTEKAIESKKGEL